MMTPDFRTFPPFSSKQACPCRKRIFKTVLGDKMVISGSENGRYFETNRVNPINLKNISSRRIQRYRTLRDSKKLKFWWCHFRFSLNSFFGRTSPYLNIYAFPYLYLRIDFSFIFFVSLRCEWKNRLVHCMSGVAVFDAFHFSDVARPIRIYMLSPI